MTTTTAPRGVESPGVPSAGRRKGFTLVELLVATGIGSMVVAAVMTTFVFFCRTGVRMAHYSDMERQSRGVLQRFGQDAREAKAVAWVDANTLQLTTDSGVVTYDYNSSTKRFTRTPSGGSGSVLVSGISSFRFMAYDVTGSSVALTDSNASQNTKMVQVDIDLSRNTASAGNATAQAVSARYVLRNKSTS